MQEKIIKFLTSKHAKTVYWTTAVSYIPLLAGVLEVIKPEIVDPFGLFLISFAIGLLNTLTKYINKTYLRG